MWLTAVIPKTKADIANHQLQPSQSSLSWLLIDITTMPRPNVDNDMLLKTIATDKIKITVSFETRIH